MKGKRTGIDFSKHVVTVIKSDGLLVHHIKQPHTSDRNIKFINTNGILAVTGDYGNWIFCREFHPSPDGGVSDGYWDEKLQIASCQVAQEYDAEATRREVQQLISGGLEEYGYRDTQLAAMKEYYEECLDQVDDEIEYLAVARNHPPFTDCESIIFRKKPKIWLLCVFDGFDEICRRLKETELLTQQTTP
jgi:hypothetical protein